MENENALGFPLLNEREIIEAFNKIQIDPSVALKKTNMQNCHDLYYQIATHVLKQHIEELFSSAHCAQFFSEMGEKSMGNIFFLLIFQEILNLAKINDFDLSKDLMQPTKKRTMVILNGLLNLIKFFTAIEKVKVQCEEDILNKEKKLDESKNELRNALKERDKLSTNLNEESSELEAINSRVAKVEEKIGHFRLKVREIQRKSEIKGKKFESSNSALEIKKNQMRDKKNQFDYLKNQIIQSPDKIKTVIFDLRQKVEIKKAAVDKKNKKLNIFTIYVMVAEKLFNKIRTRVKDCEKISELQKDIKALKKQAKKLVLLFEEKSLELQSLQENKENILNSQEVEQKRNSQLEVEMKRAQFELEKEWETLQQTKLSAQRSLVEEKAQMKSIREEIVEKKDKIKALRDSEDSVLAEANEEIKRFEACAEDFCKRIEFLFKDIEAREKVWASEISENNINDMKNLMDSYRRDL